MSLNNFRFSVYIHIVWFVLGVFSSLHAQNQNWIHLMSGNIGTGLIEMGDEIYCTSANGGIISVDKNTLKTTYINRFNSEFITENFSCAAKSNDDIQWFGSIQHLVKKDGSEVTYYDPKNIINFSLHGFHILAGDDKGNAWVGTSFGLVKFDGTNWQVFNTSNSGIPKNGVTAIYCQKDTVWVGLENGGLVKYESEKWTTLSTSNAGFAGSTVTAITKDIENRLWVGTNNMGPLHHNGSTWVKHIGTPGISALNWVRDIACGKDGAVYVGYFHREISKYDGTSWQKLEVPLYFPNVNKLLVDDSNRLWVALFVDGSNFTSGLVMLENNKWNIIRTTQYQPNMAGDVWFLEKSCDGNMWFTANGKIALGEVKGVDNIQLEQLLPDKLKGDQFLGFYIDQKNNYWISTSNSGLLKYDGDTLLHYNMHNSGIPTNHIRNVIGDQSGKLYLQSELGLIIFDGTKWELFTKENSLLPVNYITDIFIDKNNTVWIATYAGLVKISKGKWTLYNTDNSSLPSNNIGVIEQDRHGTIYVGTYKGLVIIRKDKWEIISTENSNLPRNDINDITFDIQGRCWVATDYGISMYDGTTWRNINPGNSKMPGTLIFKLKFDDNQNLWMSIPNKGLAIFNETALKSTVLSKNTISFVSNPTRDFLNFQVHEKFCGNNYFVINGTGQIIQNGIIQSSTKWIDVENFASGVYYIVIPNGRNTLSGKFVKI